MKRGETGPLVAFGEALWDCLPSGLYLGGAPFNVAYHATRLGAVAMPVTSVGRDFLGDQVMERAQRAGLDTRLLAQHPFLSTGVSIASLSASGDARYEIREPVAWDAIEVDEKSLKLMDGAGALVYGTLAARSEKNRATLDRLLDSKASLKICDVNLRAPYDNRERAVELASRADIVKLNEEELFVLSGDTTGEGSVEEALPICQQALGVSTLCVTLGSEGALLWQDGTITREEGKRIKVADTIGAGDSFTAAFAVFAMRGLALSECLHRAAQLGAFVASKSGAQPDYEFKDVFPDG